MAMKTPAKARPSEPGARDAREEKWRDAVSLMEKFPALADDLRAMVKQDMASFLGFAPAPLTTTSSVSAAPPVASPATIATDSTIERPVKLERSAPAPAASPKCEVSRPSATPSAKPKPNIPRKAGSASSKYHRRRSYAEAGESGGEYDVDDHASDGTYDGRDEESPKRRQSSVQRWTLEELATLHRAFDDDPYLKPDVLKELREQLGVKWVYGKCSIQTWFKKQREKQRIAERQTDTARGTNTADGINTARGTIDAPVRAAAARGTMPQGISTWSSRFTRAQLDILAEEFLANPFPDRATILELRAQLGVPAPTGTQKYCAIQRWFTTQRTRTQTPINREKSYVWTDEQQERLRGVFNATPYLDEETELRAEFGIVRDPKAHSCAVQKWFLRTRAACKRHGEELPGGAAFRSNNGMPKTKQENQTRPRHRDTKREHEHDDPNADQDAFSAGEEAEERRDGSRAGLDLEEDGDEDAEEEADGSFELDGMVIRESRKRPAEDNEPADEHDEEEMHGKDDDSASRHPRKRQRI